jgi:hypothetical protein
MSALEKPSRTGSKSAEALTPNLATRNGDLVCTGPMAPAGCFAFRRQQSNEQGSKERIVDRRRGGRVAARGKCAAGAMPGSEQRVGRCKRRHGSAD